MPDFRREVPEYVPEYRRIPRDAPVGTFYCEPCDDLHYPGDICFYCEPCDDLHYPGDIICWYYEGDPDGLDELAIAQAYPEWSGDLSIHYDVDCIFVDENGEDR